MSDTLSQWEAESSKRVGPASANPMHRDVIDSRDERILTLIELIRKKDEAFGFIYERINFTDLPNLKGSSEECKVLSDCSQMVEQALALTEAFK